MSAGHDMRIQLSTWNINGLRSSFRNGLQGWLAEGSRARNKTPSDAEREVLYR